MACLTVDVSTGPLKLKSRLLITMKPPGPVYEEYDERNTSKGAVVNENWYGASISRPCTSFASPATDIEYFVSYGRVSLEE